MKKPTARTFVQQGFSLVELLVVIAVIAVIAAIAIPNIANITGSASDAKNQRNAQNLANLAAAARAAGHTNQYTTVTQWVTALTSDDGIAGTGTLTNAVFRMDSLSTNDVAAATNYLGIANETAEGGARSTLVYSPSGPAADDDAD